MTKPKYPRPPTDRELLVRAVNFLVLLHRYWKYVEPRSIHQRKLRKLLEDCKAAGIVKTEVL